MEYLIGEKRPALRRIDFDSASHFTKHLNSVQTLVLGYFLFTLMTTSLLMLPQAASGNRSLSLIDALFVASSGISTTGLTPVDISRDLSLFGQLVLLVDFQVGGLGYMAIVVWLAGFFHRRLSLKSQLIAKESVAGAPWFSNGRFFGKVVAFTLFFELMGGMILAGYWARQFPLPRALYLGIFHSISAFCTAGFSLFSDSLASFQSSLLLNLVIIVISLSGAIGFFVLAEFALLARDKMKKRRGRKLSIHSKLVIVVTLAAVSVGTTVIFLSEEWPAETGFFQRILSSSFQAISASTTDGFNTMNIGGMAGSSLLLIIVLMIIGASPGSTGGGIKTTTLGVILSGIKSQLLGREDCNVLEGRISDENIRKSFSLFFLFVLVIVIDLLLLARTEHIPFLSLFFETTSALGNTGLSMGPTSSLSGFAKLLLSMTMFIGRVGPLTIGMALVGKTRKARFHYPDGEVFIG